MLNVRIPEEDLELRPRITVVGVGGGGSNAVNNMIRTELQGVEFLVCNTDAQALKMSLAERKIQLGLNVTRGLGGGARPDVGRAAAEESIDEIMGYLEGSNMVFITAGMGGATGTGGSSVIARAARDAGILTVGVVTKPFHFEGAHRMRQAEAGIEELQQYVDTLLIIPNQNLFRVANEKTTFADAFKMADEVLHSGVRGVTDLMVMPGLINLDFADIRAVMSEMGKAMMGTGESSSERRAIDAAEAAINNPLLEDASMQGARGLLVNITGGMDMTLFEVDEAMNRIRDEVDPEANIIFGSTFSPELEGKIRVSVVATGIDGGIAARQPVGGAKGLTANDSAAATFNAQFGNKPGVVTPGAFSRGATIRTNATQAAPQQSVHQQAPQQTQQYTTTTNPRTGTTNMMSPATTFGGARAAAMAANPGFYSRAAQGAAARRIEEPMTVGTLEEETFEAPAMQAYAEDVVQQTASQMTQAAPSIRGERDDDGSFIPPAPSIIAETKVNAPTMTAQSAPAAQRPVAPQAQQQQTEKRQGGFFDRFTSGASRPAQPAAPQQPVQPTLTVDNSDRMPAGTTSFEDDLEIPAFLRRQAN